MITGSTKHLASVKAVDPLRSVIATYDPQDDEEQRVLERMTTLLDRDDPWRVLLRWHRRVGRWLHVGGHGDPGELDPWDIARREAREESGLTDLQAFSPRLEGRPLQIAIVPVAASKNEPSHEHADIRYLLATEHPDNAVAENDKSPLRWLPIPEALAETDEAGFRQLLERVDGFLKV
jgi:8-oxo-dGTP pyrophosphatase MutT (NUDIX family)